MKDGLPVIQMTESRRQLEVLLRFCHSNGVAKLKTLNDISDALVVAKKFEMGAMLELARAELSNPIILEEHPVLAFMIAFRNGFEEEARKAMKATLSLSDAEHERELKTLWTPNDVYRLLTSYREDCRTAVLRVSFSVNSWLELDHDAIWNRDGHNRCGGKAEEMCFKHRQFGRPQQWWIDY
jgi:hypothetical protein